VNFRRLDTRPLQRLTPILLLLVLTACVRQPPRPVGIKVLSADLVFGIPPIQEPVAPPNVQPFEDELPEEEVEEIRRAFVAREAPVIRCPEAPETSVPEEAAPREMSGLPEEGSYKWVLDGYTTLNRNRFPIRNHVQTHWLTDLNITDPGQPEANYEWKMVEVEGISTVTQTYVVDKTTPQQQGLKLAAIERRTPGLPIESFRPNPPILLLPNDFMAGNDQVFRSAGVDPQTFQALEHTAFVLERRRVDACGEILDSWFVDGQQELISREANGEVTRTPINFDYYVATNRGGMIIQSVTEAPCPSIGQNGRCNPEGETFIVSHIGQVNPGPKLR
jgi:hypothetical protein